MARFWPSLKPDSRNFAKMAWYKVEGYGLLRLGPRTPTRATVLACCARAASGHTAAPPSSVMKLRLLMSDIGVPPPPVGLPHAQPAADGSASPWGRPELF